MLQGDAQTYESWDNLLKRGCTLFHLASASRGTADEVEYGAVRAARNLVRAALSASDVRVVFASSTWAVEHSETPYGRAKRTVEEILREKLTEKNGCSVVSVRFPNLYGPMCRPFLYSVVATFCWLASRGRVDLPLSDSASAERPYLGVEKAVRALLAAAIGSGSSRTIDLVGAPRSAEDWARRVASPRGRAEDPDLEACYSFFAAPPPCVEEIREGDGRSQYAPKLLYSVAPGRRLVLPAQSSRVSFSRVAGEGLCDVYAEGGWYRGSLDLSRSGPDGWSVDAGQTLEFRASFGSAFDVTVARKA